MKSSEVKNLYDTALKGKYQNSYEHKRWFSSELLRAGYDMTKQAIERHALTNGTQPKRYLEVGPGPGTWTKLFLEQYGSGVAFDLVDISEEMLKESQKTFSGVPGFRFFNADFTTFESDTTYDLFFSSRALEYVPDKGAFIARVANLLNPGGRGFIITKTPKYAFQKLARQNVPDFHKGQIAPRALTALLREQGFVDVVCYPVTFTVPLLRSARLNRIVGKMLGGHRLTAASAVFTESYAVSFRKP